VRDQTGLPPIAASIDRDNQEDATIDSANDYVQPMILLTPLLAGKSCFFNHHCR
jgi:hypothetical protein